MSATVNETEVWLADVHLLCVECSEPIKARINSQSWIKVEWIGPEGQCRGCYQELKEEAK
jgi:hypothetical protein